MNVTRRSFVGNLGSGVAALGALGVSLPLAIPSAEAQVVYTTTDWKMAEFDKLLKQKARVKQVYDSEKINDGGMLNSMKNSFNGLHFGYGVPESEIKIVGAFRGQANLMNFDDSMWEKYRLGEYTKTNDPKTEKPATRNIFYAKGTSKSMDPNDREGFWHDTGMEALVARGASFLSCHNATEAIVRGIIKRYSLTDSQEEVVHDLQSHLVPGAMTVPAMVAALAMLQAEGKFTYVIG